MDVPKDSSYIPYRTLETEFPATNNSMEPLSLHGYSSYPILQQAIRCRSGPIGVDVKAQTLNTEKNRETYQKWKQQHSQRVQETLPHADSHHLRETAWYDPSMPAQYLQSAARWGTFSWRDSPILGKEFVVNRHKCETRNYLSK
ncbi:tektin bundle-interacting protein 1 [Spea bombifrons]|uniref:tektin bundle-interacting protein 1 n=1 Tax=Spea bombifrons TaxID=233779 RepID=UPI00234A6E7E|nr:tektin bundle-interacting protein 1 [Spea bombifrons]